MTDQPNVYEDINRGIKVTELVRVLGDFGVTAAQAANLDTEGRNALAELAEVNPPSDKTWAVVVGIMERKAAREADPFDGLPTGSAEPIIRHFRKLA